MKRVSFRACLHVAFALALTSAVIFNLLFRELDMKVSTNLTQICTIQSRVEKLYVRSIAFSSLIWRPSEILIRPSIDRSRKILEERTLPLTFPNEDESERFRASRKKLS